MDKINMVKLEILSNMAKQLTKAYNIFNVSIAVLNGLFIVIIIDNIYQLPSIAGRIFWKKLQIN